MPTIAIDYTPAYEQGGGIGRYVRELTTALAEQPIQNQYKLFVSGATTEKPASIPATNFIWKPTRISPKWFARIWHRAQIPLPVEIFTGRIDLFHATDFVLPPTLPNTKTILTVHDLSFIRTPETASPSLRKYLERVVPRSIHKADHILADSQATKADIIQSYNTSPNKITVLLSGVNERFQPVYDKDQQNLIREKYKLQNFPFIFSIGTVQPRKNYVRLIQALGQLHQQNYNIHLVIAGGKGWLDDPIYTVIQQNNLQEFVHLLGFADDEDLPALYSMSECFAFPSLYEGFGLPILEAMACHTPVVTSNNSSLIEVAGDATLLIDPTNTRDISTALQRILDDSNLRQSLINKGILQAQKFRWYDSAQHLHQIYGHILTNA